MTLYIRNMACESCKIIVKDVLESMGCVTIKVELGEVQLKKKISGKQQEQFGICIRRAGLELVSNEEDIMVDKIKKAVLDYVENSGRIKTKLSDYLVKKLNYDYAYLSGHFSEIQHSTIEQFMIQLKIEKVKELLVLHNMTLTQIADKLNYSSVAHLSNQFKKVTGVPATTFKNLKHRRRKTIQEL
jgi:YesN/AraC family two-component response regulator